MLVESALCSLHSAKVTEAATLEFGGAPHNGHRIRRNTRFDARGSTGIGDGQHREISFGQHVHRFTVHFE
jgi:hypothetical protein